MIMRTIAIALILCCLLGGAEAQRRPMGREARIEAIIVDLEPEVQQTIKNKLALISELRKQQMTLRKELHVIFEENNVKLRPGRKFRMRSKHRQHYRHFRRHRQQHH